MSTYHKTAEYEALHRLVNHRGRGRRLRRYGVGCFTVGWFLAEWLTFFGAPYYVGWAISACSMLIIIDLADRATRRKVEDHVKYRRGSSPW